MTDISGGQSVAVEVTESPEKLLQRAVGKIGSATFTGKGDKPKVQQLMHEFEWDIMAAVQSATVNALSVALDPRQLKRGLRRLSGGLAVRPRCEL